MLRYAKLLANSSLGGESLLIRGLFYVKVCVVTSDREMGTNEVFLQQAGGSKVPKDTFLKFCYV